MNLPLQLRLRPSPTLLWLGILAHSALLGVCQFGLQSIWLRLACSLVIAGSLIRFLADERTKRGCLLALDDAGLVALGDQVGCAPGQALTRLTDFRWAVWLTWQVPGEQGRLGRTRSLMLLPDHLPRGEWRALKIWLRHEATFVSHDEPDPP